MLLLDPNNFSGSDSEESLLPDERGSFSEAAPDTKQQAKMSALRNLGQLPSGSSSGKHSQIKSRDSGVAKAKLGQDPSKLSGFGGAGGAQAMGQSSHAAGGAAKQGLGGAKSGLSGKMDAPAAIKDNLGKVPVVGQAVSKKIQDLQDKEGRLIGFGLWLIWGLLSLVSLILLPTIIAPLLIITIFNLLLVSPRLVYVITEFILDLVAVGEVLQGLSKSGLIDKSTIAIGGFEKTTIILFDLFLIVLLILIVIVFITISCWLGEQTGVLGTGFAKIVIGAYDWWNGTQYSAMIDEICSVVRTQ